MSNGAVDFIKFACIMRSKRFESVNVCGFLTDSQPFIDPNQKFCPITKPGSGVPDESSTVDKIIEKTIDKKLVSHENRNVK